MDNAGDWLNIVIMVAAGIIGLLNSGKKKQRPTKAPQTSQQEPDIDEMNEEEDQEEPSSEKGFWELLEEIQEKKEEPAQPEAPIPTPTASIPQPVYSFKDELSTPAKPAEPDRSVAPTAEERDSGTETTFIDRDELRKAIIYTEILQRKY